MKERQAPACLLFVWGGEADEVRGTRYKVQGTRYEVPARLSFRAKAEPESRNLRIYGRFHMLLVRRSLRALRLVGMTALWKGRRGTERRFAAAPHPSAPHPALRATFPS